MGDDAAGLALLGIVNKSGQIPELPQTATKAEYIIALNKLIRSHNEQLVCTVYSDTKTNRMIVGYQLDGWGSGKNYGIKISKEDYDVLTTADANLLFKLAY